MDIFFPQAHVVRYVQFMLWCVCMCDRHSLNFMFHLHYVMKLSPQKNQHNSKLFFSDCMVFPLYECTIIELIIFLLSNF